MVWAGEMGRTPHTPNGIARTHDTFARLIDAALDLATEKSDNPDLRDHIGNAHKNFLRDASYLLFSNNREKEAGKWFDLGTRLYGTNFAGGKDLVAFSLDQITENINETSPDKIKAMLEGLVGSWAYNLAIDEDVYEKTEREGDAADSWAAAAMAAPRDASVHGRRGAALGRVGKWDDARRSYERATELETERECMVEMLGMARANFRTLAALVSEGNITAARAMIAAIRSDGDAEDGVALAEVGGEARLTGWVVQHLAMATAAHLDALPAPNHCAWAMEFPARVGRPARTLDLVAQWSDGETTAARIGRLTAERDAFRAALALAATCDLPTCGRCDNLATRGASLEGRPPFAVVCDAAGRPVLTQAARVCHSGSDFELQCLPPA